jgi:hypothetical protein
VADVQLAHYLGLLHRSETLLARAFREVGAAHAAEPDVELTCEKLAADADAHAEALQPFVDRYGEDAEDEPDRLHNDLFRGTRSGPLAVLRDLHDLYLLATECDITWTLVGQAAQGARDHDLIDVVGRCEGETALHLKWLKTRMKATAPQTLVVA